MKVQKYRKYCNYAVQNTVNKYWMNNSGLEIWREKYDLSGDYR
jgi:hypothetical protein